MLTALKDLIFFFIFYVLIITAAGGVPSGSPKNSRSTIHRVQIVFGLLIHGAVIIFHYICMFEISNFTGYSEVTKTFYAWGILVWVCPSFQCVQCASNPWHSVRNR